MPQCLPVRSSSAATRVHAFSFMDYSDAKQIRQNPCRQYPRQPGCRGHICTCGFAKFLWGSAPSRPCNALCLCGQPPSRWERESGGGGGEGEGGGLGGPPPHVRPARARVPWGGRIHLPIRPTNQSCSLPYFAVLTRLPCSLRSSRQEPSHPMASTLRLPASRTKRYRNACTSCQQMLVP